MIAERLAALGGTHHGHVEPLPVAPDAHPATPRRRGSIRLVLDRYDVRRVIDGTKDRHVRLWHRSDPEPDVGIVQVGERIPVQKKGGKVVFHVTVLGVDMRELGEMDLKEAYRHGYRTTRGYQRAWLHQHDKEWAKLSEIDLGDTTDDQVAAAWEKYSGLSVWVITFALLDEPEGDQYLAPGAGYTGSAARTIDAQEIERPGRAPARIPLAVVTGKDAERITLRGEARHEQFQEELTAEQLEQRTKAADNLVERFMQTVAIAREKGIDPHSQIRLVGRALTQLEQAINQAVRSERAEEVRTHDPATTSPSDPWQYVTAVRITNETEKGAQVRRAVENTVEAWIHPDDWDAMLRPGGTAPPGFERLLDLPVTRGRSDGLPITDPED